MSVHRNKHIHAHLHIYADLTHTPLHAKVCKWKFTHTQIQYMCMHTHAQTCIHTNAHIHTHICPHTGMCIHTCTFTRTYIQNTKMNQKCFKYCKIHAWIIKIVFN